MFISTAIERWRDKGVLLNKAATDEQIRAMEDLLHFAFPVALRNFWLQADGFYEDDLPEGFIRIWSIERVLYEHATREDKTFIGFADFMLNSWAYGFFIGKEGIYKDCDSHLPVCNSFETWVHLVEEDSNYLH
ncbi:MAG: SMI1/KNR4 family protein [Chitinophagaceae bacterium]